MNRYRYQHIIYINLFIEIFGAAMLRSRHRVYDVFGENTLGKPKEGNGGIREPKGAKRTRKGTKWEPNGCQTGGISSQMVFISFL